MNLQTKKILGINVTTSPSKDILEEIRKYFEKAESVKRKAERKDIKPLVIFTPNPEIINFAQKDEKFKQIVNTAQINLPDGAGIVWAMKKLHGLKIDRIAGIDFMLKLVNLAAKESLTIGLIGGRGDLADVTAECLLSKHKNLRIEVFEGPEVEIKNEKLKIKNYENKKAINTPLGWRQATIQDRYCGSSILDRRGTPPMVEEPGKQKISILFVALGFPKQEYFIESVKRKAASVKLKRPLVLMAVGGAFDYISGRVPRAPLFVRNLGLEWLYRLIREPWRLPRQLTGANFFPRILLGNT